MSPKRLQELSDKERQSRRARAKLIADQFGFTGQVEYRHVYSTSGGAQYAIGPSAAGDLLVVYPEAFERDADPNDFSLASIIAHERGHQLLHRDPRWRKVAKGMLSESAEEVLASLIGSLLVPEAIDRENLILKAIEELSSRMPLGMDPIPLVLTLRDQIKELS